MTSNPNSPYTKIKSQLRWDITGRQDIICPKCNKGAVATTGGKRKVRGVYTRFVRASCRHCGTTFTFEWS